MLELSPKAVAWNVSQKQPTILMDLISIASTDPVRT